MENSLPDQFLFINKTAKSKCLSHSKPDERFNIHSHVSSKHHKENEKGKKALTPLRDASTHCPQPVSGQTISPQTMQAIASKMGLSNQPGISEPDILNSAIIRIDKREYRLMQYPFSAFIRISFLAEAMSPEPETVSFEYFRHKKAAT